MTFQIRMQKNAKGSDVFAAQKLAFALLTEKLVHARPKKEIPRWSICL